MNRLIRNYIIIEKNKKTFFDFWEVGEVRRAAIFCLRSRGKVEVSQMGLGMKLTGYHLIILIHLLMLWKTNLDQRFGHYDVSKK